MAATERQQGLQANPENPLFKVCVLGFTAPGGKKTNADKDVHGVRYDTVPIANGVINAGASCDVLNVPDDIEAMDDWVKMLDATYDGLLVRINPGHLKAAGLQRKFDTLIDELSSRKPVWTSPKMQATVGAKEALVMCKDLPLGLPDTYTYATPEALVEGLRVTAAFQPRVLKQNRGSSGEGIWKVEPADGVYPSAHELGAVKLGFSDKLKLTEMNDGHVEEHTLGEFLDWCTMGREKCEKNGQTWTSCGKGNYMGDEGTMADQRFMELISEGEYRLLMTGDHLIRIEHFTYGQGIAECTSTPYPADEPKFAELVKTFVGNIPNYMEAMGMQEEALPVFWTGDMIMASKDPDSYVMCEMNASCVGVMELYGVMGSSFEALSPELQEGGMKICNLIGQTAVEQLKGRAAKAEN